MWVDDLRKSDLPVPCKMLDAQMEQERRKKRSGSYCSSGVHFLLLLPNIRLQVVCPLDSGTCTSGLLGVLRPLAMD